MAAADIINAAQVNIASTVSQLQSMVTELRGIATAAPVISATPLQDYTPSLIGADPNYQPQALDSFSSPNADPLAGVTFPGDAPVAPAYTPSTAYNPVEWRDTVDPTLLPVDMPDAPVVQFAARPDLIPVSTNVQAPQVNLAALDLNAFRPADGLPAAPDLSASSVEREFAQAITDERFATWLQSLWDGTNLDNGHRLFQAGRDRIVGEARRGQAQVMNQLSARNLRMPSGLMADALREVARDTNGKLADLNREITLKRADQLVLQQQDASGKAIQFIDMLKRYAQSAMDRALQLQRINIDAAQVKLQYAVQAYNAKLEALRTYLAAWTEERQRALVAVEVFQQLIAAERLKVDVNAQQIAAWDASIRAERAKIDVYSELVRGVGMRATVNQSILEAYRTRIQAEVSRFGQNELKLRAIEAEQRGEQTKFSAFGEQVRAYGAQVEAANAKVQARVAALQAQVAAYRVYVDQVRTGNANLLDGERLKIEASKLDVDIEGVKLSANRAINDRLSNDFAVVSRDAIAAHQTAVQGVAAAMQSLGSAIGGASSSIAGVAQDSDISYT